jgi:hypothetical protein
MSTTFTVSSTSDNTVIVDNGPGTVSSASVGGSASQINTTVTIGNGPGTVSVVNSVSVRGSASQINVGSGVDVVNGGTGDTITLFGNKGSLALLGMDEMVFLSGTNSSINDLSQGMTLVLSGSPGNVNLSDFADDHTGVIDLRGGIGGFATPEQVVSALTSDGHGGTLLSFGSAGSLDFVNTPAADLTASHFAIG